MENDQNDTESHPLYQHVLIDDQAEIDGDDTIDAISAKRSQRNFIVMSICFSANHAAAVSCLSLATARLGQIGAESSSILYSKFQIQAKFRFSFNT